MSRTNPTNLKAQIAAVVAAALALAVACGWMLSRTVQGLKLTQATFEELRSERWKALMRELHGELRRVQPGKREAVLRRCVAEEPCVKGAFIWSKNMGVTCSVDMPPELAAEFPPSYQWEVDGKTGALAARALQTFGAERHLVAWRRIPGNEVAGVLVENPGSMPFDDPSMFYWAGGFAVAFVFALAAAGIMQIVRSERAARREAAAKASFVSLVSHELNTPLTAIIPYADMLRKGRLATAAERQEAYETIADEAARLKSLVAELLDFSRLERGVKRYQCEDFDIGELVRSTAHLMRGRFPDGALTTGSEGTFRVHADVDAVKAILVNLLDNAAKYGGGAPVQVHVVRGRRGVRVAVMDRGPGLPPDGAEKVFERFWRANGDASEAVNGFGLGLSIARMYARDMGGDLFAAPRPGGGAMFILELMEKADG